MDTSKKILRFMMKLGYQVKAFTQIDEEKYRFHWKCYSRSKENDLVTTLDLSQNWRKLEKKLNDKFNY